MQNNKASSIREKIFEYTNYRLFLDQFYKEQKQKYSYFSHRYFALKAGFKSPSFYTEVVKGKYNLTDLSIKKMIKGVGFDKSQSDYFSSLVQLNQSSNSKTQERLRKKLDQIRERSALYKLGGIEVNYLKEWYYQVIRELVVDIDWKDDYKILSNILLSPLSVQKIKEAVDTLIELGLIKKNKDGCYAQTNKGVTSKNIPASAMMKARRQTLELGIESLEKRNASERYIAYSTVSISENCYNSLTSLMDEVREKMLELVLDDTGSDRIYEIVFQMFPVTERFRKKSCR